MTRRLSLLVGVLALVPVVGLAGLAPGLVPGVAASADGSAPGRRDASGQAAAASGWTALSLFDDYRDGSVRGQGPWTVGTTGDTDGAVVSDTPPGAVSGKALLDQLSGFETPVRYRGNAAAALGDLSLPDGLGGDAAGTLFVQVLPTDLTHTDLHLGLSADPAPSLGGGATAASVDLDDLGPEITLDHRGLVARDGDVDRVLSGVPVRSGELYRLWLTVDTAADTFQVHASGAGRPTTLLSSGGRTSFAFRTPGPDPLVTLLQLNDPVDVPSADTYLDSVYLAGAPLTTDPSPHYARTLDLDALAPGPLGTRGGWRSTRGASVVVDPADPDNRALRLAGPHALAQHATGAGDGDGDGVADGATGTLFFRLRRSGGVDASVGLSDVARPDAYADYRAQVTAVDGALRVRDGASSADVGRVGDATWQCVWLVADHATDRVSVYSRGGPYRTLTRLPTGAGATYGFRAATSAALDQLVARTGGPGPVLLDDLAVDPGHVDLAVPHGASDSCVYSGSRAGVPVADPAPAVPQAARYRLDLTRVARFPSVSGTGAGARLNYATTMPGTRRLVVPDLDGVIRSVDPGSGSGSGAGSGSGGPVGTYLDVRDYFPDLVTSPGLGTGVGSIAFDPDFARDGVFYTVHTEAGDALTTQRPTLDSPSDASVQGVVTQWVADDPAAPTFSGTHRQVLRIGFSKYTHGIQQIAFDPRTPRSSPDYGLLYVGVGDGDETPVFSDRPQRLDAPQGKVLRIDPLPPTTAVPAGAGAYTVPPDNPFVGRAGALGEVYARGLRNPHRFTWAPDNRMFLGNIGEKRVDSVYQVEAGDDFGWNRREGRYRFDPDDPTDVYPLPSPDTGGFTYPVLQIGRDAGVSLVGGFVAGGASSGDLRGHYLFGDIVSGLVRETSAGLLRRGGPEPAYHGVQLSFGGRVRTLRQVVDDDRVDLRFGQGADGALYLMSKATGTLWRVSSVQDVDAPISSCRLGRVRLRPPATTASWKPLHPRLWRIGGGQVRLRHAGRAAPGPRRPREYAVLRSGPVLGSFQATAQVRIDRPTSVAGRDVVLVFDYRDARHFSYVHLSQDPTSYAHNGIFVVDGADRRRVDDQWTGERSAAPAITDRRWHDVRVRACSSTGQVAVYLDGSRTALMTATDTALTTGRLGFGSFDDYGRLRDLRVRAARAD